MRLFLCLQTLDLLTSWIWLSRGFDEANPFVRFLISRSGSHLLGLLAAKLVALGVGLYAWRSGRLRLLMRANLLYLAVVVWNLWALILLLSGWKT